MKKLSANQIRDIVSKAYWQGHADGKEARDSGTDWGAAEISISQSVAAFYPKSEAASVIMRLARTAKKGKAAK